MGAILGLASITKVSGLVLFPLTGLALLIIHQGLSRTFVRDGVVIAIVALLIGGWWYARNGLLYGDPLSIGVHTSGDMPVRLFGSRIRHDLLSIEHTFWSNLSRTFVSQMWLDKVLVWWGRVSLVLLGAGFLLNRLNLPPWALDSDRPRSPWRFRAWIMVLSWPLTYLFLLIAYWTQEGSWAYGRLLFPAVGPIALYLVLGWVYVVPPDWRRLSLTCSVGAVMIISSLLPSWSIYPMYHPWHRPDNEHSGQPVGTIYSDSHTGTHVAQLLSYNLPEPYVLLGEYLPVEMCWEPLGRTEEPYAVLVQLLDLSQLDAHGSPGVWGGRRTYPGLGNLPTDRWRLGEPFCDRVLVSVSPVAPTPLGAAIEVGFIEPETGKRLQASGPQGSPADMSVLRGIPILNAEELPTSRQGSAYVIDQAIGLNQVIISTPAPGDMIVTLVWQSLQPVIYDATVFVHLLEAKGDLLAQVDRQPLDGQFSTSYWLPGQVVTDTVSLSRANGHHDGPLMLTVGMYTWPSLERLEVLDSSGTLQPDNVIAIDIPSLMPGEKVIVP
jgi:hypothetical protein